MDSKNYGHTDYDNIGDRIDGDEVALNVTSYVDLQGNNPVSDVVDMVDDVRMVFIGTCLADTRVYLVGTEQALEMVGANIHPEIRDIGHTIHILKERRSMLEDLRDDYDEMLKEAE